MKIGYLISGNYAIGNIASGILAQAKSQASALRELGCEVVELNPWHPQDLSDFDVIQFFQGGLNFHNIESNKHRMKNCLLVYSPIIDSNQSNTLYRIASKFGTTFNRIYTVPSEFKVQADCSDLVICRSKHEKNRVVHGLGIPEEKVEIVLNGTDIPKRSLLDKSDLRKRYDLPEKFILHVSAYTDSRKNVYKLVIAASELDFPLIVAGNALPGEVFEKLKAIAAKNHNIRLLGFVDKDHLDAMYECCKVFCLPSLHEGTGLVALEAGVRGANVVITKNGGPPDYFGDYVEYVDPDSIVDIKNALVSSWNKVESTGLVKHIYDNLKWKDSAAQLMAIYQKHIEAKQFCEEAQ